MQPLNMVRQIVGEFQDRLLKLFQGVKSEGLSPEGFRGFVDGLKQAVNAAGLDALVAAVHRQDETGETVVYEGQVHRFKLDSEKEWLTPFGKATINRRYYQPDAI